MAEKKTKFNPNTSLESSVLAQAAIPPQEVTRLLNAANPKNQAKLSCEAKGGRWDEASQSCIMPPPANVNPSQGKVEVGRNVDSQGGAIGTVTLPDGRTFMGLSPEEVNQIAGAEKARVALPENAQPMGTAQRMAANQASIQQAIQQGQGMLANPNLSGVQESPVDWTQAVTAGSLGNLPSVLTRAGAGAAAGAAIGSVVPGIGTVAGGVVGGVGGLISAIWSGTESNIKKQQSGEIAKTKDVLSAARTNIRALAMIVSKDPSKAEDAIGLYYQQMAQVQRAQRKLQLETSGNLNKFMNDGTSDLSDFELFLQPGGYADLQLARIQQAAMSGQPVSDAELLQFYEEEMTNE